MKTVFFDVDTQLDFLVPAGALYAPGAEAIAAPLGRLARFAASQRIQVISTVCAHLENDREFRAWPPHCIAGTAGQQKLAATLLDNRVIVPQSESIHADLAPRSQIVVEKQSTEVFAEPNVQRVADLLTADRYVVYGVVTEVCVLSASRGLLRTGKIVEVVTDAIHALSAEGGRRALDEIVRAGAVLTTTAAVTNS